MDAAIYNYRSFKGLMEERNGKRVLVELTHVARKFAGDIANKYIQRGLSQMEKMRWVTAAVNYLMHDMVCNYITYVL